MSKSSGGFPLLTFICGVWTLQSIFDVPDMPLDGPEGLVLRFLKVLTAVLSGVVVFGLARGEQWVARGMELWIALWAVRTVAESVLEGGWYGFVNSESWMEVGLGAAFMYLPVAYVKSELRRSSRQFAAGAAPHQVSAPPRHPTWPAAPYP